MNTIEFRVDSDQAQWAFRRAPEVMKAQMVFGTLRGAEEVARLAKEKAPKVFSSLVNSIRAEMLTGLGADVVGSEAKTGVASAAYVEEGTGPAAGRPRYYPNPDSLLDYLTNTPASRGFKWARAGSAKRELQRMDLWHRSRAMAMAIYQKGTKPHPFMGPASKEGEPRVRAILVEYAGRGIREAFSRGG
jgi:hypothetical protein